MEIAFRTGVLRAASLMVSAPAAADAVARAHRLPGLRVGLHLVVIEGRATLPSAEIPLLVDQDGRFGTNPLRCGLRYFMRPGLRRQLRAEIAAQYRAFAATGLTLDHANAHKHLHLHPTIGRLLIACGRPHGLRRIRVPAEPPQVLRACGHSPGIGARLLHAWTSLLRWQARRAGLTHDDQVFGLAWSGHMTADRVLRLLDYLPVGATEIYFHPATAQNMELSLLMPSYDQQGELAALCDPRLGASAGASII